MYRLVLLIAISAIAGTHAGLTDSLLALSRAKRQTTFHIPTDADKVLKAPMRTQFRCVRTGYFADIDNNCQMYHVCVVQEKATGHKVVRQYSFVCGNGTMFNQLTMNCDDPNESLPCEDAPRFYRLNDKIGNNNVWLHTGDDWEDDGEPGYDPADYVGSASSRRASSASATDDDTAAADTSAEDSSVYATSRPSVGRSSYGSSTYRDRFNPLRHRASAGHVYAENSRFRPNVRYYGSNGRRMSSSSPSSSSSSSSYGSDDNASSAYDNGSSSDDRYGSASNTNTRYAYAAASSDTSETSVAAPSHRRNPSTGYKPDLSATAPGIYYYKRREVPYDI